MLCNTHCINMCYIFCISSMYILLCMSIFSVLIGGFTVGGWAQSLPHDECTDGLCGQACLTLCNPMDCRPARLLCLWNFPGKKYRSMVASHCLLTLTSHYSGRHHFVKKTKCHPLLLLPSTFPSIVCGHMGLPSCLQWLKACCQGRSRKRLEFDPWWGRSAGKEMATHSNILAWRIPWTEKPGGLQSLGSQRVRHDWETEQIDIHIYINIYITCHTLYRLYMHTYLCMLLLI